VRLRLTASDRFGLIEKNWLLCTPSWNAKRLLSC
jgi:hypothetical protein